MTGTEPESEVRETTKLDLFLDVESLAERAERYCHTEAWEGSEIAQCGAPLVGGADHDWIEPVRGVCPSCGKPSCKACDALADALCMELS